MAENKTIPTKVSVDKFLRTIENERRRSDALKLLELYKKITAEKPVMWGDSIIGFGQYDYKTKSGRSGIMLAAGFSPRKANLALYVGDAFKQASELFVKLGKHKRSFSCLYINKLADIDMDVLSQIIANDYDYSIRKDRD